MLSKYNASSIVFPQREYTLKSEVSLANRRKALAAKRRGITGLPVLVKRFLDKKFLVAVFCFGIFFTISSQFGSKSGSEATHRCLPEASAKETFKIANCQIWRPHRAAERYGKKALNVLGGILTVGIGFGVDYFTGGKFSFNTKGSFVTRSATVTFHNNSIEIVHRKPENKDEETFKCGMDNFQISFISEDVDEESIYELRDKSDTADKSVIRLKVGTSTKPLKSIVGKLLKHRQINDVPVLLATYDDAIVDTLICSVRENGSIEMSEICKTRDRVYNEVSTHRKTCMDAYAKNRTAFLKKIFASFKQTSEAGAFLRGNNAPYKIACDEAKHDFIRKLHKRGTSSKIKEILTDYGPRITDVGEEYKKRYFDFRHKMGLKTNMEQGEAKELYEEIRKRGKQLVSHILGAFEKIMEELNKTEAFPEAVREVAKIINDESFKRFEGAEFSNHVGGFIFLRIINPYIINLAMGNIDGQPIQYKKAAVWINSLLQDASNGSVNLDKTEANKPWICYAHEEYDKIMKTIANYTKGITNNYTISESDDKSDEAAVRDYCQWVHKAKGDLGPSDETPASFITDLLLRKIKEKGLKPYTASSENLTFQQKLLEVERHYYTCPEPKKAAEEKIHEKAVVEEAKSNLKTHTYETRPPRHSR